MSAPWRRDFDTARDPYTARNALGITSTGGGGGGGGAPTTAEYITASADATLTNERVLTNTASITWDFTTPGQAKANSSAGGGNVSNSGTPTVGQYAKWVTATTIQGVAPATVLSDIGAQPAGSYQPLDADLTSLAAASATGAMYYRSAANTWATVTINAPLTFTAGALGVDLSAYLTSATAAATYQPLDADLTAIAALTGTNTIYYRSAANTWTAVTIGSNMTFSGGTLNSVAGGGGNVSNVGTPANGQLAQWTTATTIQGVSLATAGIQPLDATLTALAAYNTNGLLTQTAADTFAGRTLAPPAAGFTITNPAGTAGNPTFVLANDLAALEALAGTNTIPYRSGVDTWAGVTVGTGLTFTSGTLAATAAGGTLPTQQIFTSGSGTYTTPGSCRRIEVRMVGGGGGGAGGNNAGDGGAGGNTTFSTATAGGGQGGKTAGSGGGGGSASGGTINMVGCGGGAAAAAQGGASVNAGPSGAGGSSAFGGGGAGAYNGGGGAAAANTGGGGGGGSATTAGNFLQGGGGGSGGYVELYINNPVATYSYVVGAAGAAGTNTTNGNLGGAGGTGIIIVKEYY